MKPITSAQRRTHCKEIDMSGCIKETTYHHVPALTDINGDPAFVAVTRDGRVYESDGSDGYSEGCYGFVLRVTTESHSDFGACEFVPSNTVGTDGGFASAAQARAAMKRMMRGEPERAIARARVR